jgi:hypothetical protein
MDYSIKSLVGMALQEWGSERSWDAITKLQMRGSPDTLSLALGMAKSRNCRKRALGLYIASQLRCCKKGVPFESNEYALEDTQNMLLAGLRDTSNDVLCAAISGFGHRPYPLALPQLIKFASHVDQQIRFEVAFALGHYSEPESIDTLLHLAQDEVDNVRDWATFGIGSMQEADNQLIRDVLWANLNDKNEDVRGEALIGLATRKDERVIPVLLNFLDTNCRVFELDASELMASPLLLECLNAIKNSVTDEDDIDTYWYRRLLSAIDACSGVPSRRWKSGSNSIATHQFVDLLLPF